MRKISCTKENGLPKGHFTVVYLVAKHLVALVRFGARLKVTLL